MQFGGIMKDYTMDEGGGHVTPGSIEDFCADWPDKWRPKAVLAQELLKLIFPPGALVIGALITITDKACSIG